MRQDKFRTATAADYMCALKFFLTKGNKIACMSNIEEFHIIY